MTSIDISTKGIAATREEYEAAKADHQYVLGFRDGMNLAAEMAILKGAEKFGLSPAARSDLDRCEERLRSLERMQRESIRILTQPREASEPK